MRNIYRTYREHYKALFFLGLPIVIGQIGVIVLGFADTLMIGHHSTVELGAASFVNNVFNLAIIFSTGFSYGLTPVVGGLYGTHQFAPAGQALRNSLLANLMVALLLTLCMTVLYLNIENLGQPEELIPLIKPYYLVLLASLVFVMLFNGFKQFTDGITDTKTAMWILLGGNVLNIIGNYLLIYGKLGLPELGLLGAGISTLFSRIMMVLVFIIIFLRSSRFIRYKVGFFRLGWSRAIFGRLNGLGWPVAFQMGMETASFSLSAIMIGWLGTIALASHQVMLAISQFTFMMYYGMGAAVAVRVSNFKGQNDILNVRRSAYAGFHLMMTLGVVGCKTDDAHRLYRLLYHLTSRRLFLRLRNGLGGGRCLDGVPFRSDKCRINALVAFSLHDETPHSPSEYLILKTLPYGFLSFYKVESNNRLYVITCNSSFFSGICTSRNGDIVGCR